MYEDVRLETGVLMQYSGQGKCERWWFRGYPCRDQGRCAKHEKQWSDYREQLRTWASSRNWAVDYSNDNFLRFKKSKVML